MIEQKKNMMISVPMSIREWIKAKSVKNLRSMNAEITLIMMKAKEQEEKQKAA